MQLNNSVIFFKLTFRVNCKSVSEMNMFTAKHQEKVENTGARNLVPTPWACCLHADIPILYILVTHYLTHFIGQPRLAKVDFGSIFPFDVLM